MAHQDQASNLRDIVVNGPVEEQFREEVDVLSLPSRSERHKPKGKTKPEQEKKISINWHLWISRGIAFLFISLLVGLIVYFYQGHWGLPTETDHDNLKSIIR